MNTPAISASIAVTQALEAIRNSRRAQAGSVSFRRRTESGTSGAVSWPADVEALIRTADAAMRAVPRSELGEFRRLSHQD
jgi:hypothetical protein